MVPFDTSVAYTFERLGTGFLFTEGPVWHPTGKFLLWSDMPGDHLRRWSAGDGVTTFRTEADGRVVPLATHHDGKQLNSPNDIVCRSDGGVYFTDPPYGRAKFYGVERAQELTFQGVFRVGRDPGAPELLVDDFDRPNGLCFSLDESRLFINDTARKHIRVFDVTATGALRNGRLWAETKGDKPGAPDGMKIDSAGTLYCCGPGGIHVFGPDASLREIIEVPEHTANFAWGDDDYRSLFITASTSLYRIRVTVPGRPVF
jgi:gluconolactonase